MVGAFKTPGHDRNINKQTSVHSKPGCYSIKMESHDLLVKY